MRAKANFASAGRNDIRWRDPYLPKNTSST
jgi:hypothetical protein